MIYFKHHENATPQAGFSQIAGSAVVPLQKMRSFYNIFAGEERPGIMLGLLSTLVLLLHVWLALWLSKPNIPAVKTLPVPMEVSLIAERRAPAAVPVAAPTPPPPVAPQPKKPKPKPLPKKPPLVEKPLPKKAEIAEKPPEAPKPAPVSQPAAPPAASTSNAPPAVSAPAKTPPAAEPFTEPNYRANYAVNPKPEYPRLARNRGWQGKVLLRVQVSSAGASESVSVHQSSGHDILDEAAVAAVEKWKFIPAKRGDSPVASSVIVPIIFTLNE